MKIAISNIAWDRQEDETVAELMQKHQIKGIEVAPGKLSDNPLQLSQAEINAYITFWKQYDVDMIGMQSMLYGHPELVIFKGGEEIRQQTFDYMKGIIDVARQLGVIPMVFGSPKNRQIADMEFDKAFAIAVDFFGELADFSEKHNTILCIEPNARQYDCDFLSTTEEALELVKTIDHPAFRIHLDTAIMTLNNEDYHRSLDIALPYLAHFHVSEPYLGVVKAGGDVDHKGIAKHLKSIGYDKWVSIEMRGGWTAPDAKSVEQALEFVNSIYGN